MSDTPRMQPPDVSLGRSGDVAIAHEGVGEGPKDIVFVRGSSKSDRDPRDDPRSSGIYLT